MSKRFKKDSLNFDYLSRTFSYDEVIGELYWSDTRPQEDFKSKESYTRYLKHKAGKVAGNLREVTENLVYRYVSIHEIRIYAHHIVWYLKHKRWPFPMIDHIDGNGLNNKMENLRECISEENQKNTRMYKSNSSGVTGVSWREDRAGFVAYIGNKSLGQKLDLLEACCRRKSAELNEGYSERTGK